MRPNFERRACYNTWSCSSTIIHPASYPPSSKPAKPAKPATSSQHARYRGFECARYRGFECFYRVHSWTLTAASTPGIEDFECFYRAHRWPQKTTNLLASHLLPTRQESMICNVSMGPAGPRRPLTFWPATSSQHARNQGFRSPTAGPRRPLTFWPATSPARQVSRIWHVSIEHQSSPQKATNLLASHLLPLAPKGH